MKIWLCLLSVLGMAALVSTSSASDKAPAVLGRKIADFSLPNTTGDRVDRGQVQRQGHRGCIHRHRVPDQQ